jgi:hypothetical protein
MPLAFQRLYQAIDALAVLLAPLARAQDDAVPRGDAHVDAVPEADHHHADVESVAAGLLGLHLIVELGAGEAGQGAMLGRYLQARIAGE